jgi:hypothetical protein
MLSDPELGGSARAVSADPAKAGDLLALLERRLAPGAAGIRGVA